MFSFSCSNEGPTQVTSKDVFIWRGARLSPTLNFSHFPKWEVNNNKSLPNTPKTLNSLECDQIITSSSNISLIKSSTQSLNEAQPSQLVHVHDLLNGFLCPSLLSASLLYFFLQRVVQVVKSSDTVMQLARRHVGILKTNKLARSKSHSFVAYRCFRFAPK